MFDGSPDDAISAAAGGNLEVLYARRKGRDAADDRIVEEVERPASATILKQRSSPPTVA
ncbi:MAG: hypothetical protein IPO44_03965 [Candidatus Microthrix sp.]|nr:hypothetical protein [Candidatus Microthrix sp.]MBK9558742.1 hypothetical protein [Candidatus Microthrix sp.]